MTAENAEIRPVLGDFDSWIKDRESNHFLHNNKADPEREEEFFGVLPNSDLGEWIYRDSDIFKAFEALPIWRLHRIKQLSFLTYVGPDPSIQILTPFDHTRFQHTLFVAQMTEKILRRNDASEHDLKLGINSAMAHDQATPGLGDATKKIDPQGLNEEDYWFEVMEDKGWDHLKANGIAKEEMDDAIHNRGLVGKVLDIADRISYVMLDLDQIIRGENIDSIILNARESGYRAEIAEVLQKDTNIGSIFEDVAINWETQQVYFRNPDRLRKFLEIRALLNKYLYMHPVSQARDMMVVHALKPHYSTDESEISKLTPAKLRKMSDDEVISFITQNHPDTAENISQEFGKRVDIYQAFVRWYPQHYQKFETKADLDKKRSELEKTGFFINGVIDSKRFNTATDYLVLDDNGIIKPFKEYDPDCAGRIERIADSIQGHILYWQKKRRRIDGDFYMREFINTPPIF